MSLLQICLIHARQQPELMRFPIVEAHSRSRRVVCGSVDVSEYQLRRTWNVVTCDLAMCSVASEWLLHDLAICRDLNSQSSRRIRSTPRRKHRANRFAAEQFIAISKPREALDTIADLATCVVCIPLRDFRMSRIQADIR